MQILIAEDETTSLVLLKRTLQKWGHEVVATNDGRSAWEILQRDDSPRMAILDYMMPHMDGLEVCRQVRQLSRQDPTYLILLTTRNSKEDTLQGFASGADDYIVKPFEPTILRCRVAVGERVLSLQQGLSQKVRELGEREARLRSLFETAADGILTTQADGTIETVNRAALTMFGYEADEVIGRNISHFFPQSQAEFSGDLSAPTLTTMADIGRPHEIKGQRSDGTPFPVRLAISQVQTSQGPVSTAMMHDLTAEKQLQCELAQAQRLESVGQLAAGIAHEINTPTQYVGDNSRFLKDAFSNMEAYFDVCQELIAAAQTGGLTPRLAVEIDARLRKTDIDFLRKEVPAAIDQTLEGIDRVVTIVRAMKEFSHPGSGEKVPLNLNEAIATTVMVSRNEWKYVAEIETDLDPNLPAIPCLANEINQVILNLIVNASHAIADSLPKGSQQIGKIHIATRVEGDMVEFEVRDTGGGIPEAIRQRIFDPFFTTKEVGRGTGQGLTIARSIVVDKHGGSIQFQSTVGQGTTFLIRLPRGPQT